MGLSGGEDFVTLAGFV